jgi:hypothetical protein
MIVRKEGDSARAVGADRGYDLLRGRAWFGVGPGKVLTAAAAHKVRPKALLLGVLTRPLALLEQPL